MVHFSIMYSSLKRMYRSYTYFNTSLRWKSTLKTKNINKLLVANRGEIACRVMRTAKRLGIRTVGVYSDVDRTSLHVSMADEAYCIGPAPPIDSYLRGDKLLQVAKESKSDAIHPGYGFLSENAEFAENCHEEGIIFIGPPASAIRNMGIKSTSKEIMSSAGVPVIKGYHGSDQSNETLKSEAQRIGFPIMIKAVRGGGGKGMRIAFSEDEFQEKLESARTESEKSFGNSDVLLEKFITEPRHVEVQVFADTYGNVVHLYERDCSIQRRHQKIIEEAPAPGLSSSLRSKLGEAAVKAAKAVGYVGAGTVEFILDKNDHSFHFMEMNTRLQVEHPITEMITGTDLVEWQIKISSGEKLPASQADIPLNGHAFEARIYAEDPDREFLPGAGPLLYLSSPPPSDGVRIETGVREGDEVSVHYDPMIAKLITWGKDRREALSKLQANLLEYNIAGVETNINFLLKLAKHPDFSAGMVHTNFIQDHKTSLLHDIHLFDIQLIQAALAVILDDKIVETNEATSSGDQYNPFVVESNFRINHKHKRDIKLMFQDQELSVKVEYIKQDEYNVSCDEGKSWKGVQIVDILHKGNKRILNFTINGVNRKINFYRSNSFIAIFDETGKVEFSFKQPSYNEDEQFSVEQMNNATAPMPGVLDKILVKPGDSVEAGDPLFVLIAMKMEYIVKATRTAKVGNIFFKAGESVSKDAIVVEFEK